MPHAESSTTIPVPPTRLVGRERDLDAVAALLTDGDTRLVTLSGPGGVGKTHLALELARRLDTHFADGVVFVPLAATRDPGLVLPSIAQSLGLREAPGQAVIEAIATHLSARGILVILDNLEQVLDAAPDIGVLIAATARPRFLATSRSPLRLRAEREYPVLPLDLPAPDATPSAETCRENAAVRLFVERAQARRPSFTLTDDNAPIIVELCRRLDGLPLAIELAAAMTPILSPPALLARMDRRLPLLVMGATDLPARQRTLRDAIAWSYDLLNESEQAVFRRLSVFARGASLDAVEAVIEAPGVLGTVSALVTKSLLMRIDRADQPGHQDEQPRFLMLSTIREFAAEELEASGEEAETRARYLRWLLSMAEAAETGMTGPDQVSWLDRLDLESQNLRAGLEWALDHAPEDGMRLASMLWRFWATRGLITEGYMWICRFIESPGPIADAVRAKAFSRLGNLCIDLGNLDRATEAYTHALELWERIGDPHGIANTLNGLGLVDWYRGENGSARQRHERSLEIRRQLGDRFGEANSLTNLGNAIKDAGDSVAARPYHEQALAIRMELGDRGGVGYSYLNLGDVERRLGDAHAAREMFRKSLDAFRDVGDRLGLGYGLQALGMAERLGGKPDQARAHFREALAIRMGLGDRRGMVESIEGIAAVLAHGDQAADATVLFAAAEALRAQIGVPLPEPDRVHLAPLASAAARALPGAEASARRSQGEAMTLADAATFALEASDLVATPAVAAPGGLSDREVEVVQLVATGMTNAEVAERLYLSRRTVDAHLRRIYDKLELASRTEVVRYAMEHGLV